MSEQNVAPTKQIRVRRTTQVTLQQEYTVDIPADYDPHEWIANDMAGFDEFVTNSFSPDHEDYSAVDDDQLDIKIVEE